MCHLQSRLIELLANAMANGEKYVANEQMTKDAVLMPFLNQFADPALRQMLAPVAFDWWFMIATDVDMPAGQLAEAMYYITYCYSMQSISKVLDKIHQEEQEKRLAIILAMFLWQLYKRNEKLIPQVWSALKSCGTRYFPAKEKKIIFDLLFWYLRNYMEKDSTLDEGQKAIALFEIPEQLPFSDKTEFINYFTKNRPSFSH
jgi:hypothetical protein